MTLEEMKYGFQFSYEPQLIDSNCPEPSAKDFGAAPGLIRNTVLN